MLKVQKRTLLLGWYFMGFAMGRESEVGWGSCVWGRMAGRRGSTATGENRGNREKVARLQGEK